MTVADAAHFRDLVLHLARAEVASRNRWTLLGAAWPLVRQLAQLGVLVFVFSTVLDLGTDDFAVYVFSGLIAWNWFSTGVSEGTSSVLAGRHLVFQARFQPAVLPVVAVVVALVDALIALPVLVAMLAVAGDLDWPALALPGLLAVQLVLMAGIAWLLSAAAVYVRDVPNLVTVVLTLLFYLTPVFYTLPRVPEEYRDLLRLNPMTTVLESYRAVLMDHPWPPVGTLVAVGALAALLALAGFATFRRAARGFVDEL